MDSRGNICPITDPQDAITRKLIEIKRPLTPREVKLQKIGRNAPCGCGSGVKFKKCCYGKTPLPMADRPR